MVMTAGQKSENIQLDVDEIDLGLEIDIPTRIKPMERPENHLDTIKKGSKKEDRGSNGVMIFGSGLVAGVLIPVTGFSSGNPEADLLLQGLATIGGSAGGIGSMLYSSFGSTIRRNAREKLNDWYIVESPAVDLVEDNISLIEYRDGLIEDIGDHLPDKEYKGIDNEITDTKELYEGILAEWYKENGDDELLQLIGFEDKGGYSYMNLCLYAEGAHQATFTTAVEELGEYAEERFSLQRDENLEKVREYLA